MPEMMPKLSKGPFVIADCIICGAAAFVLYRTLPPEGPWEVLMCIGALAAAAWGAYLCILPYLTEYRNSLKAFENQELTDAVAEIKHLRDVARQISEATGSWQKAQELSVTTVHAAREISERMSKETAEFQTFMRTTQDQEKATLRLEIDKLRRGETEWLQTTVRLLDHTFALHGAAVRSGQENVVTQLGQFQNACRDVARRMGLLAYASEKGEIFDERAHHWEKGDKPPVGSVVDETLATGYTFQGQLVRKALVSLQAAAAQQS
jgi:molecular chaperone GrpE (heat shock protein)